MWRRSGAVIVSTAGSRAVGSLPWLYHCPLHRLGPSVGRGPPLAVPLTEAAARASFCYDRSLLVFAQDLPTIRSVAKSASTLLSC